MHEASATQTAYSSNPCQHVHGVRLGEQISPGRRGHQEITNSIKILTAIKPPSLLVIQGRGDMGNIAPLGAIQRAQTHQAVDGRRNHSCWQWAGSVGSVCLSARICHVQDMFVCVCVRVLVHPCECESLRETAAVSAAGCEVDGGCTWRSGCRCPGGCVGGLIAV